MKNQELEQLALVGLSSSTLVHEIRNPLSVFSISLETLIENLSLKDDALSAKLVKKMESAIADIDSIISNTQALLRGDKTNLQSINILPILEQAVENCQHKLESRKISVTIQTPIDFIIDGNPHLLLQLFILLLNNASDAVKDLEDKWIKISFVETESDYTISFMDSGIIDLNVIDEIFSPLHTSKGDNGTGIGCFLGKKIMAYHDGSIECKHHEEHTVFELKFKRS